VCGGIHRLEEDAVDAQPDFQRLFLGLDVNVAGALLDRVGDQVVDEADDRRFVAGLLKVGLRRRLLP
jgi:hypothetical protein